MTTEQQRPYGWPQPQLRTDTLHGERVDVAHGDQVVALTGNFGTQFLPFGLALLPEEAEQIAGNLLHQAAAARGDRPVAWIVAGQQVLLTQKQADILRPFLEPLLTHTADPA